MTGILLIVVAGVWLFVSILFTRWVAERFQSAVWRTVICIAIFPALLVAPMIDELIGKRQFHELCNSYAVQIIDEVNVKGAKVVSTGSHKGWIASNTAVRIEIQPWIYQNLYSRKTVVSYHTLRAKGGWLIRALHISENQ